jgi:medium-chain acyl-[acyl-carrier-protein] hydrolase
MNDAGGERLTLACFPYAGADGSLFASWRSSLGEGIEVLPLAAPAAPAAPGETLLDRAEGLLAELGARCRTSRFAFFGHSLGALTAFEATRALVRRGEALPEKLIVSAHPPPGSGPGGAAPGPVAGQSLSELVTRAEALPDEVREDEELLAEVVAAARRDLELLATYRYVEEPPLPLPIVAIGGRDDRLVDPATLPGWRRHSGPGFSLRLFPGGHMFIDSAGAEVRRLIGAQLRREAVDA